jgi:hypothetical protein
MQGSIIAPGIGIVKELSKNRTLSLNQTGEVASSAIFSVFRFRIHFKKTILTMALTAPNPKRNR